MRKSLIAGLLMMFAFGVACNPKQQNTICKLQCYANNTTDPQKLADCLETCGARPTPSPTVTATPSPVVTATSTAAPSPTQVTAVFQTSVKTVNGFAHCNPDAGGFINSPCDVDVTILFYVPGYDIVPKGTSCGAICTTNAQVMSRQKTWDECVQDCYNHDDPYGMCCGGSCACDVDHLPCERTRVACNGVVNDFRPVITITGPDAHFELNDTGFGGRLSGSGPVTICADVPTRPVVTTFLGRVIKTDQAVKNCKSGTLR